MSEPVAEILTEKNAITLVEAGVATLRKISDLTLKQGIR